MPILRRALVPVIVLGALALAAATTAWFSLRDVTLTDGRALRAPAAAAEPRSILWETPRPLAITSEPATDQYEPRISNDGATLFLVRGRAGANADIFVARRTAGGWSEPQPLTAINTDADELGPEPSPDGQSLLFSSNRSDDETLGGFDLYISRLVDGAWSAPENLGPAINTRWNEHDPALAPDGLSLYFASNRPRDDANEAASARAWPSTIRQESHAYDYDLFHVRLDNLHQSPATPLIAINTVSNEGAAAVSPAGDFLYFASDRPGGRGGLDIYRVRIQPQGPWPIENIGPPINSLANELDPAVSAHGFALQFATDRPSEPGDETADRYALYESISREVYRDISVASIDWAALWAAIAPWLLWLLLALLLALLLWLLSRLLSDPRWKGRWRALSLLARCLILSALAHLLLLALFTIWQVSSAITSLLDGPGQSQVALISSDSAAGVESQLLAPMSDVQSQLDEAVVAPSTLMIPLERAMPARLHSQIAALPIAEAVLETQPDLQMPSVAMLPDPPIDEPLPSALPELSAPQTPQPRAAIPEPPSPAAQLTAADSLPAPAIPTTAPLAAPSRVLHTPESSSTLESVHSPIPFDLREPPVSSVTALASSATSFSPPSSVEVALPKVAPPATRASGPEPQAPPSIPADLPSQPRATPSAAVAAASLQRIPTQPEARSDSDPPIPSAAAPALSQPAPAPTSTPRRLADGIPTQARQLSELALPVAGEPRRAIPIASELSLSSLLNPTIPAVRPSTPPTSMPDARPGRVSLPPNTRTATDTATLPARDSAPAAQPASPAPDFAARAADLPRQAINLPTPADPAPVMYPQRAPEARQALVEQGGGGPQTEEAVQLALSWLASVQLPSGAWNCRRFDHACPECDGRASYEFESAMTGLALLCFLGADHTHMKEGPYQQHVRRGIDFLRERQSASGDLRAGETLYSHGIASIALAEAYGMTRDPALAAPVQRAIDFIVAARSRRHGGWRYEPRQAGDTSVLGWQVMALESARRCGINVPAEAIQEARSWLPRVTSPQTPGLYAYQPFGKPTESMTAEALFVRQLVEVDHDPASARLSVDFIMRHMPQWRGAEGAGATYFWYYATLALYQHPGEEWDRWNRALAPMLIEQQRKDGAAAGSWDPSDRWSEIGGRIYQTALCTLMLEVYYRYLPTYLAADRPEAPTTP